MTKKPIFAAGKVALLGLAAGLAWACSATDFTGVPMLEAASVLITEQRAFVPDTIVVPVDATVTWANADSTWHTVTADPSLARDSTNVQLPAGAAPFNSDSIAPNGSYSHKFTVAGTYKYFSIPDEDTGMIGWVVVQ